MSVDVEHKSSTRGPLRVILVGGEGVEDRLFGDPGLDVYRVERPLHAIGEVADPPGRSSAMPTVVIVDRNVVADDEARDLIEGLRLIDPATRVLGLRRGGADGDDVDALPYDGSVGEDVTAATLRTEMSLLFGDREANDREAHEQEAGEPAVNGAAAVGGGVNDRVGTRAAAPMGGMRGLGGSSAPGSSLGAGAPGGEKPVVSMGASVVTGAALASQGINASAPTTVGPASGGPTSASASASASGPARGLEAGLDVSVLGAVMSGADALEAALAAVAQRLSLGVLRFERHATEAGGRRVELKWGERRVGDVVLSASASGGAEARVLEYAAWLAGWASLGEQVSRLRHEAFTDDLTGAFNRRFCNRVLPGVLERARKSRRAVSVMMFDIDDFKSFNDAHGHAAGDMILRETVRLLRSCVRPTDRVCRIGGDEFVVIFDEPEGPRDSGTAAADPHLTGERIAERFQQAVNAQRFPSLGIEAPGRLTISGGFATFPWDAFDATSLMQRADDLARQSKRGGKNTITFGRG